MTLVISLIVIICLLLVLVVLAQNSKGGGLSSNFGGSGTTQMIGVKRTGDLLEKITWGLAIALLALSLVTNVLLSENNQAQGPVSPNIQRAEETIIPTPGSAVPGMEEGVNTTPPVEGDTAQ